ncbi:MAG: tRNA lysidine(34) synthetase TilS, partial [Clostridia bacterium]|nr:tRNA lysidine(34) synthetase TilS [Clostridia bacterium]
GKKKGTYIDFDALPPNTQLRTRQSSDRIHPLGAPGSMTLKKFFINKKIPQDERARLPLLACGHEILAVFGITVSERAKVTERSQKILYIFEGEDT